MTTPQPPDSMSFRETWSEEITVLTMVIGLLGVVFVLFFTVLHFFPPDPKPTKEEKEAQEKAAAVTASAPQSGRVQKVHQGEIHYGPNSAASQDTVERGFTAVLERLERLEKAAEFEARLERLERLERARTEELER